MQAEARSRLGAISGRRLSLLIAASLLASGIALIGPPDKASAAPLPANASWEVVADGEANPEVNPFPDSYGNANTWRYMYSPTTSHDPSQYGLFDTVTGGLGGQADHRAWTYEDAYTYGHFNLNGSDTAWTSVPCCPTQTYPAHSLLGHPGGGLLIVGWKSPFSGTASLAGSVTDRDPGGTSGGADGVIWTVDKNASTVASGSIANGGTQSFFDGTNGGNLKSISLVKGDVLYVTVEDGANGFNDLTEFDVTVYLSTAARTLTLEKANSNVFYDKNIKLTGKISSDVAACKKNQTVEISRVHVDDGTIESLGTVQTDNAGEYLFLKKADENAIYTAGVDAAPGCGAAESTNERVNVRLKVGLTPSKNPVQPNTDFKLTGVVAPCDGHEGMNMLLFKVESTGGRETKVDEKPINDNCKAVFTRQIRKTQLFKAVVRPNAEHLDHVSGFSKSIKVNVDS